MDQQTRNLLQNATQRARRLLETEIAEQLGGTFDILQDGTVAAKPGPHLTPDQTLVRGRLVESVAHRAGGSAQKEKLAEAVVDYTREAAFTILNRFVALKMLEARSLVQQCISQGDQSSGFKEFTLLAPALATFPDKGFRLYLECVFDELSVEVKILFDRHDPASLIWPRRQSLDELLAILNDADLGRVWGVDETIGWVYQYFNSQEERRAMRDASQAPRNSRELAVRNQFFTPRYVVQFLTDNTLGRTWYEMRHGNTSLKDRCEYLVRRRDEVFLSELTLTGASGCEGPVEIATVLLNPSCGSLLPFGSDWTQPLIDLAHCVNAYERHPLQDAPSGLTHWDPWQCKSEMASAPSLADFTTQDILDVMFYQCRADRHGGGDGIEQPFYIRLANEVRQRVLDSQRDDLTWEQRLRQPVFVPFRAKKDPRDLRMLDPASGSGHFLLYCFDLLLTIYEEAWNDEDSPESQLTGKTLRDDYPAEATLREAIPELILRHNLYGIDIDPRCAQIAALALWMRAQRAFAEFKISRDARRAIRKTNIVVAEPMPGEAGLLDGFCVTLDPPLLGHLLRYVFGKMPLAGAMGYLLKLDELLREAIAEARDRWIKAQTGGGADQHLLFGGFERRAGADQLHLDFTGITNESFWREVESRFRISLAGYAEHATFAERWRRKLFSDDAAASLGLIDIELHRYDVILMNPPFGAGSSQSKRAFEQTYPRTKNDLYAAFVERGIDLLHAGGVLGAITSRTGFFLGSFQTWREEIVLKDAPPVVVADLGHGVLDGAMVEVAAYCLEKVQGSRKKTLFLRLLESGDKAVMLREAAQNQAQGCRYDVHAEAFRNVPRSPFAYWVSPNLRLLFAEIGPFQARGREARYGASPKDRFRFVIATWEASSATVRENWMPLAKGGKFAPYYSDIHLLVRWKDRGSELKAHISAYRSSRGWGDQWSASLNGYDHYGRRGLTWTLRTSKDLSLRAMPAGCIFADKGPAVHIDGDDSDELLALLALAQSSAFAACVELQLAAADAAARSYEVGIIQRTPVPQFDSIDRSNLARLARRAWSLTRHMDTRIETSHAFELPCVLQVESDTLAARADAWSAQVANAEAELAAIRTEIDARSFDLYGINAADRRTITAGFGGVVAEQTKKSESDDDDPDVDETDVEQSGDRATQAAELLSWTFGTAVARFDVRLANGKRVVPPEPEPFDPLPACSPGMLTGEDGLPAMKSPAGYPIAVPEAGILVDDPGHVLDLTIATRRVFDVVFTDKSDIFWREATELLDPRGRDLRTWLSKSFFDFHLKHYSKSRRKAPIYWPLATPSASYTVWVYAHRVSGDTLFRVQKLVEEKLEHEQQNLSNLKQTAEANPTSSQRKELETAEGFVAELATMLDEVKRVAPVWKPELDDGVVLVLAALWRLFPQHRAWQNELKGRWGDLCEGKYDWAHVAMYLWPERVVPKCQTDRSLAIAHGLEDAFWEDTQPGIEAKSMAEAEPESEMGEDADMYGDEQEPKPKKRAKRAGDKQRWVPKAADAKQIEQLITERSSSTVKAALRNLLDAPMRERKTVRRAKSIL